VCRSKDRLQVFAELADTATLAIIATGSFEGHIADLFTLPSRLAERILQNVAPHLRRAELRRARSKRTENLDAYEATLCGLDLLYRLNRTEFEQARQMFERSIGLDDNYAAPYAFLALWHSLRLNQGWSEDQRTDRAQVVRFASAALLRDPIDPYALSLSGHLHALLFRDFPTAFDLFDRSLRATPNSAFTLMRSSPTFSYIGNSVEARRRAEKALRLSPFDPHVFFTYSALALADYTEGDYDCAIEWSRRSATDNPGWTANLRVLAASLAAGGRIDEARQIGGTLRRLEPNFRVRPFCDAYAFAEEARRRLLATHLLLAGLPE
jgi:tetratricopeptide (TPR) repeat protein